MTTWIPVPEPQAWTLPKPLTVGGLRYETVTMSAPTSEDVLKATAVPGAAGLDVTLRIIASASAEHVPYDVLKKQPHWFNQQISDYMEEFVGSPAPDPLEAWRTARREVHLAELKAAAEAEAAADALAKALTAAAEAEPAPAS
jgi:hypothetical protein